MLNLTVNIYLRIIKTFKSYIFIFLNMIFVSIFFFVTEKSQEVKFQFSSMYRYNIDDFREQLALNILAESIYFIPLGLLLWIFILFEIIKFFATNNTNGILLTHITKPVSRLKYFYAVIIAIFCAYFTLSVINIVVTFLLFILTYGFISLGLFKLVFGSILFLSWRIPIIISTLVFIVMVIRRNELAIITCVLLIVSVSYSILLKNYLIQMSVYVEGISRVLVPLTIIDGYPYMFITRHIFYVFNEENQELLGFYNRFGLSLNYEVDPDLGFTVNGASRSERLIETFILVITPAISIIMLIIATIRFKRKDITGH